MLKKAAYCTLLCFLCLAVVFGQQGKGTISGTLSDPQGAVVPGAKVSIRNTGTNLMFNTVANESGFYTAPGLPVGEYEVAAELQGFKRALRRGIRVAIVGRPNAGKSSLLNQLLGHDRAIVSAIPGTTRDTIEETANIRGLPVVFIDTAGLREGRDEIEVEGIRRSRQTLQKAELILHVLDQSEPWTEADEKYLAEFSGKKRLLVLNKMDLPARLQVPPSTLDPRPSTLLRVSCLTGQGIESLKDAIKDLVWSGEIKAEMLEVMINSRHQDALNRARAATLRTLEALRADQTLELVALDLRIAVNDIGEIVGKTTTEDLLDLIFSQFCIGK